MFAKGLMVTFYFIGWVYKESALPGVLELQFPSSFILLGVGVGIEVGIPYLSFT